MASRAAMINRPDIFGSTQVASGSKKLDWANDLRVSSGHSMVYTVAAEDNTTIPLIRKYLLANNDIKFCGYRIPHPLVNEIELRVTSSTNTTPDEALLFAVEACVAECTEGR
eukprot:GHVH01002490.1.p1 GENE.GHVH01002490.1~~GHVH01002490.1.p1  ORF type:complete len:112 (-),score=9.45 GHVH01002490.1:642-977(-)